MIKYLALSTLVFFSTWASAEIVERIVAIVNSEVILESDVSKMRSQLKKRDLIYDYLIPENESAFYKGDRDALLQYMINERVMDSEVKRLNLTITNDRVDQEIREIAKRNQITVQGVLDAVASEGLSATEYKNNLKTRIERQSLIESEIISKLRISDEDAYSEYLRQNPNARPTVNEYSIAHILFSPQKGGAEAALKRAEDVLGKLKNGQSFETLAEQYSEDPNFSNGGYLGSFKTGEFLKELENAVTNLNPGQYSNIVRTRAGFHIVKLLNKKATSDPNFNRVKDRIKSQIFESTFRRQLRLWLQMKREESFVRINDPKN